VRDGEEAVLARREDRLLFRPVGGADRKDRTLRRPLVAEPLDVRLAERALPRELLARDLPGAMTVVLLLALGHLGQLGHQAGHIIEGLHE
jgi:hypothetical protein